MFYYYSFILLLLLSANVNGQFFRPISRPSIFTSIRFQNTACTGDSGESGTCINRDECNQRGGSYSGACGNGLMTCCSFKFTCGGKTVHNETIFVNPSYPRGENGTNTCQVTIDKDSNVCQLRLDLEEFELSQPDENGRCTNDSFMVRTTVGERLPMLCGQNKGQHLYVDMGRGSGNPVVLSVVTNGQALARKWKIKISMIPCTNLLMAPSGCLQYYRSPSAIIKSFNYGTIIEGRSRYLSNLRYTACVRVEENFCAIKWSTNNEFSFGVPQLQTPPVMINSNTEGVNNGNQSSLANQQSQIGFGAGFVCNQDDYIGIDQSSIEGSGPGEDRLCGSRLLQYNYVISRSKPFQLKVRSNSDSIINALYSQNGFSLQYVQLPCVN